VMVLALWSGFAATRAEEHRTEEARRLAERALAERKKADHLESGWEEAYDRGIELANQSIALDPNLADAYYALFVNLGRKSERTSVAAQALNINELKKLLRKTLELDPRHPDAWEAQGEMLLRLPRLLGGSESDGEQALRRSAELDPKWAKPPLRLAELHWKKGRKDDARAEAERARALARAAGDDDYANEAEELLKQMGVSAP